MNDDRRWGDTGTFLDEVPTVAIRGEKKNDDGLRISVLRWHFEDDIQYDRQELVQREFAAYAIKRELKDVRDRLLDVADQPDVETFKGELRKALDTRINRIEGDTGAQ